MRLISIEVSNYRSVAHVRLDCTPRTDRSSTFGLIGLNEAGKSSILKAVALITGEQPTTLKDWHLKDEPIVVSFFYECTDGEIDQILTELHTLWPEHTFESPIAKKIAVGCEYSSADLKQKISLTLSAGTKRTRFVLSAGLPKDLPFSKPIFWKAADNYLISKPIDLTAFAANPPATSIPLRNCFIMAGFDDIPGTVAELAGDSTAIEHLQNELGRCVTRHIRSVWPNHPIEISFLITNNQIHFHVKDVGAAGRAKTADQRSDGFKQFVSFLLTVSAQNKNEELSHSILLLDEPETHLHPLAQEFLLSELIKITSNERSNTAYFATHSNYMIDKQDLSRNYRVIKKKDVTEIEQLDKKSATYAGVGYEVFEILSSDYHNELYSKLHEAYQEEAPADDRRAGIKYFDNAFFHAKLGLKNDKPWKRTQNSITLPTYIRNCIHHSENGNKYSEKELKTSIEIMRKALI